jgi:hypothetical protein
MDGVHVFIYSAGPPKRDHDPAKRVSNPSPCNYIYHSLPPCGGRVLYFTARRALLDGASNDGKGKLKSIAR